MKADAANYTKKCDRCQWLAPILKSPMQYLISISSPWPFAQCGIDIVGPLPTGSAQKKLLLVATDYFSKWVEVETFSSIKDRDVTQFIWKNIVCRFGIPQSIVSDNGPQFDSRGIWELLPGIENKESVLHSLVSAMQWPSRSLQ